MRLLVLGGTLDHLGGLEAVCDRSIEALQHREGWHITRLATATAFLNFRRLPKFLRALVNLARFRKGQVDCVWLHYVNLPDLTFLAMAKLLGLRVIVTPHLGTNWRSQTNTSLRRLSRWLLGFADRLALLARTQESEVSLPPGVPKSYIRTFLPATIMANGHKVRDTPPTLRLLHAARLSEGKGTFAFISVCERLKEAGVAFTACIAGGADEATLSQLHAKIAACKLLDDIDVLGRLSDQDMRQILISSDVLVHLSRIDSYPLTVLEAMACGVLPICIELAGARDMINNYDGELVDSDHAIDEAVSFLTNNSLDDIRRRAAVAAVAVRRDFDWDECAQLLTQALHACTAMRINTRTPATAAS